MSSLLIGIDLGTSTTEGADRHGLPPLSVIALFRKEINYNH